MSEYPCKFLVFFLRKRPALLYTLAAVVVLIMDYLTGRIIRFPIAYALPVVIAAWIGSKYASYCLAVILPLSRVLFHFLWHETDLLPVAVLNAMIAVLALLLYAYLVQRVSRQKKLLSKRVNLLEGILPVCASRKRIRTEKGNYEQIEKYIAEHTGVSFSHGLCPECFKKLYPEYYKDDDSTQS